MSIGFIRARFDLCTGCSLCQLACSQRLFGGYNPGRAVIKIEHRRENLYHLPIVCTQCENAYCANVCPFKAIKVDEKTDARIVDDEKCDGCGLCVEYCPIGVIFLDPDTDKVVKCDLCGGDPQCVKSCPTDALTFIPHSIFQIGKNTGGGNHG